MIHDMTDEAGKLRRAKGCRETRFVPHRCKMVGDAGSRRSSAELDIGDWRCGILVIGTPWKHHERPHGSLGVGVPWFLAATRGRAAELRWRRKEPGGELTEI